MMICAGYRRLNTGWRSDCADSNPKRFGNGSASKCHRRKRCEIDMPLRGKRHPFGLQLIEHTCPRGLVMAMIALGRAHRLL